MSHQPKTAITNVRVFDGFQLSDPTTVVIEGDQIVSDAEGAVGFDGGNGVLLPGLIDTHVHCTKHEELWQMARAGITTALDMGCWPIELVDSLRNQRGVTDFRSAGLGLTAPGSTHSCIPSLPKEAQVVGKAQAIEFVSRRLAEGSDYIKIWADVPGPDQETLNAATEEAKRRGKLVIAHATAYEPFQMAQKAKVDFLTHVPLDKTVTDEDVQTMRRDNSSCIPTLAILEGVSNLKMPGRDYIHCQESVGMMHKVGVPILAGTDANAIPGAPVSIKHGEAIHHELQLLVKAGLSPTEALRSATSTPAKEFGLNDRGFIKPGYRADLVLIAESPLSDITATNRVLKVWCGGIEVSQ